MSNRHRSEGLCYMSNGFVLGNGVMVWKCHIPWEVMLVHASALSYQCKWDNFEVLYMHPYHMCVIKKAGHVWFCKTSRCILCHICWISFDHIIYTIWQALTIFIYKKGCDIYQIMIKLHGQFQFTSFSLFWEQLQVWLPVSGALSPMCGISHILVVSSVAQWCHTSYHAKP